MKKHQKYYTHLLRTTLGAAIVLTTLTTQGVSYAETQRTDQETQIKVKDIEIPREVMAKVNHVYMHHVTTLNTVKQKSANANYQLGEPFKIYKFNGEADGAYYFPIISDGRIKYIATVYKDHEKKQYVVRVNAFIAEALNQHKGEEISLFTDENGYYMEKNKKLTLIHRDRESEANMHNQKVTQKMKRDVQQVTQNMDETAEVTHTITGERSTRFYIGQQKDHYLKHYKIRERQYDVPWCSGYSMAFLLNATYNTDRYNAHGVMQAMYPDLTEEELRKHPTHDTQMLAYARSQGRNPQIFRRSMTYEEIYQAVDDNVGIMMSTAPVNREHGEIRHAIAAVGTTDLGNGRRYIVYWNPWDQDISSQDADSTRLHFSNGHMYEWNKSVVGF